MFLQEFNEGKVEQQDGAQCLAHSQGLIACNY